MIQHSLNNLYWYGVCVCMRLSVCMERCFAALDGWMCTIFFGERTCTIPDRHGCFILALAADPHAWSFVMLLYLFFLIFCFCFCFKYSDIQCIFCLSTHSFVHRFAQFYLFGPGIFHECCCCTFCCRAQIWYLCVLMYTGCVRVCSYEI